MADTVRCALPGCFTGLLVLAAMSQGSGLSGLGFALPGHLLTATLAGMLAWLAASGSVAGRGLALLATTLASSLAFWHPNPSLDVEYGIDRGLLLPELWRRSPPMSPGEALATAAACLAGGCLAAVLARHRGVLVRVALAILIGSFLTAAPTLNPRVLQEATAVPQPGAYSADTFLFLRAAALMREGTGYYPAFHAAYVQRKGETGAPGNPLNWRPPLLAHLWAILPDGAAVLGAFWLLAALSLAASWDLARRSTDEVVALWAPLALASYLLYGACSIWFGTYEYWAAFPLILGLWAWGTERPTLGAFLIGVAAMTREQFVYLLPLLAIIGSRDRRGRSACWGMTALATGYYVAHYLLARPYVDASNRGLAAWSDGGPEFLYRCWMFGTVYLTGRDWLWIPTLLAGYAASLRVAWMGARSPEGPAPLAILLAGTALVPSLAALAVGQVERWYWGVAIVPQLLLALPFLTAAASETGGLEARGGGGSP